MPAGHETLTANEQVARAFEKREWPQKAAVPFSEGSGCAYQSDTELVQACLDGQQDAWDTLVERYGRLVYSIPLRWGLSRSDADDVFQIVFMIVYRRLHSLREQAHLSTWLITVTSRECWRLGQRVESPADLDETLVDVEPLPAEVVQEHELKEVVRAAISRLDSRSKDLIQALFFETNTPSYEKIAARLGLAVGTIGSARARSLKKLETNLVDMGIDFR
jgi:RNA polymerase sigma factor (sigma-70 family)